MFPTTIFETCRITAGSFVWGLDAHLARLQTSAGICQIDLPVDVSEIKVQILKLDFSAFSLPAKLRISVSESSCRIEVDEIAAFKTEPPYKIISDCFERTWPAAKYEADFYHKFAQLSAQAKAIETIWFDANDVLLEGSFTNVMAVIDGALVMPKVDKILPGIMREWVLKNHKSVLVQDIKKSDLNRATEILLTNSLRGILKVDNYGNWKSQNDVVYKQLKAGLRLDGFY